MPINDDPVSFKNRERTTWTNVAPGWRKHDAYLTEITEPVTERMLTGAMIGPGQRVLDIASGTGEPAIPAAVRVQNGHVIGTDFVEEMLAFAGEKAAARGLRNIEFHCVDGEELDFPDSSFDAVTIRWGLMFMPDPLACLRRAFRVLKPGGRIAVACWAGPEQNLWASLPMRIIRRELDLPPPAPGAPGIFAFADQSRLTSILGEAGFRDVSVEPIRIKMADFDSGEEYFAWIRELAGPVTTLFAELPAHKQRVVKGETEEQAEGADGRVEFDGVSWVADGSR
jgi:ubiquinone/menaquinone biosynthesis C-methylase UbiE